MVNQNVSITQYYYAECYDKNGILKWTDGFKNLVVTVGRNHYLNSTLKNTPSAAWYVGLKNTGTIVAADTMASHAGWTENAGYSNATRPIYTLGTASNGSVDNSASKAIFTINATGTIAGGFITDSSTKSGTAGILLGAGNFATSRGVESGDTLNLTVVCSVASA
jgi:hypothetical protein